MKRILLLLAVLAAWLLLAAPAASQENQADDAALQIAEDFLKIPGIWEWTVDQLRKLEHDGPFLVIYYEELCRYCGDYRILTWVQDNAPPGLKPVFVLHPSYRPHDLPNIKSVLALFFDAVILPDEFKKPWKEISDRHGLKRFDGLYIETDEKLSIVKAGYLYKLKDPMAWLKQTFATLAGGDSNEK